MNTFIRANSSNIIKTGITGSTLKIIAVILMLIDHFGAIVIWQSLHLPLDSNSFTLLKNVYTISRNIGRISFPIFIFLLVEGFIHTSNVKKYALRLLIFAFVSEIPFNLAIYNNYFASNHQNVFFTLFIGLLALICFDQINKKFHLKKITNILIYILISIFFMAIAKILHTDYHVYGVLAIILMYLFRSNRIKASFAGSLSLLLVATTQIFSFISMIPIALYNGKRGMSLKYAFYIFYPAHLLILYFMKIWIL